MSIIKSISYNQDEILWNILKLHVPSRKIDCDPTFSKGNFYKTIPRPKYKFDLIPQTTDTVQADCRHLPLDSGSLGCINFDPPFLLGLDREKKESGEITKRFMAFAKPSELYKFYRESLCEFYRILVREGILIFKCQDTVSSGKQFFSHNEVYKQACEIGFYPKDLFILLAKNRMIGKNHHIQQHARKFHSYFWVFQKRKLKSIRQEVPLLYEKDSLD